MGTQGVTTRGAVVVGAATIASALATDLMGLHFIIGAFLVGAIMPANLHKPILDRLQVMTLALLMPFFFTLTGMRTLIDLSSPALLQFFSIAIGVGAIGIIGGTAVAARLIGERWSFGRRPRIPPASQGSDRTNRSDGSFGCWDHLSENFRRHDSHGGLQHRACDAACSTGVRSLGYAQNCCGSPSLVGPGYRR